jgi:hypothetical protein
MLDQQWAVINEMQKHLSVINEELGKCQVDILWLNQSWWEMIGWLRMIVGGVIVGILLSLWNLILMHRNGKPQRK